jgi:hypothetical protein
VTGLPPSAARSAEESFLDALSRVSPHASAEPIRSFFRRVTPPATTWCVEIDDRSPDAADFCFAMKGGVELPPIVRDARAFRRLTSIVGTDGADGRWFFEVDLGAGAVDVHAFARLRPAARFAPRVLERLRSSGEPALERPSDALEAFIRSCGARFELSDVGVVDRADRLELRVGVLAPAEQFTAMLNHADADGALIEAFSALVPAVVSPDRCILQLALPNDGQRATCTGVEVGGLAEREHWTSLFDALVDRGWSSNSLSRAAIEWCHRERLARTGNTWPSLMVREISHVKLVARDGAIVTKAYLLASENFALFD